NRIGRAQGQREPTINYDDEWRVRTIAVAEFAPGHERNPERPEEIWPDSQYDCRRRRVGRRTCDRRASHRCPTRGERPIGEAHGADAWHLAKTLSQRLQQPRGGRSLVAEDGRSDREDQHVLPVESKRNGA